MRTRRNCALQVATVATLVGVTAAGSVQGQMVHSNNVNDLARAGKLALERDPLLRFDPYTLLIRSIHPGGVSHKTHHETRVFHDFGAGGAPAWQLVHCHKSPVATADSLDVLRR